MERIWKAKVLVPRFTEGAYVDVDHITGLHNCDGQFVHAANLGSCLLDIVHQKVATRSRSAKIFEVNCLKDVLRIVNPDGSSVHKDHFELHRGT